MLRSIAVLLLMAFALQVQAKVDAVQASRLGGDLTPLGGERGANATGTIPAWAGGLAQPIAGYQTGMHHPDPYAGDTVQYVVNSKNLGQYQALLPLGLKALLESNPDYYLRVFPTRRSAAAPQRIYDATRLNALDAELISHGNGVQGVTAGVPFPLPQTGQEAIWNHIMRYRGDQVHSVTNQAAVLSSGDYSLLKLEGDLYFRYGREGVSLKDLDNTLFFFKYKVIAPAKLAGSALLVQDPIDQVLSIRKAWRFNRDERRVRRLPMLAFDSPQPDTFGMVTADMIDSYNGAPDRYDWQLLGKQELLVPYNSYAVHQQGIPYTSILQARSVNPELLRYELHRVWVVEAALRKGFRHPYAKRRFYLDEDSWQILVVDLYDTRGELIGLQESHPISYYEVPMFGSTLATVYDFQRQRYFVDGLDNNEPMYDFHAPLSPGDFTPQALRRGGN
ncbi:DUF1329 domain-containing protein [Pseudomonas sp. CrR25]|nr:DUF1329 domain-containing protein [Pseudomonas sp. CrR25]